MVRVIPQSLQIQAQLQLTNLGSCHNWGQCTQSCVPRSVRFCNWCGGGAIILADPSMLERHISSQNTSKMQPSHSQVDMKTLKGQAWEVVANMLQFIWKEEQQHRFVISSHKSAKTCHVCNQSLKCNTKYKNKILNLQPWAATTYNTPKRNTTALRQCTKIDNFDMCVVRTTINKFYLHDKTLSQ